MAIIRKSLNDILVSKPKVNHAIYDATTDQMIAQQQKKDGFSSDLTGNGRIIDNRSRFRKLAAE